MLIKILFFYVQFFLCGRDKKMIIFPDIYRTGTCKLEIGSCQTLSQITKQEREITCTDTRAQKQSGNPWTFRLKVLIKEILQ